MVIRYRSQSEHRSYLLVCWMLWFSLGIAGSTMAQGTIQVFPSSLVLRNEGDRAQLVVLAEENGATRDVTAECLYRLDATDLAEITKGRVQAKSNGQGTLYLEWRGIQTTMPIEVKGVEHPREISFEHDVQAALSKQACNSGACHGSPSGKGGFRLSLRGFDSALDRMTLIREDFGRRLNTVQPEASLLLLKPLMKTPHGGGMKLHKQDAAYGILRDWIAQGAKTDAIDAAKCIRIEVLPSQVVQRPRPFWHQQLSVWAHFSDGSKRDITPLAVYESSSSEVASVDGQGLVRGKSRGESVILVRYLEHIESIHCLFKEVVEGFVWSEVAQQNYVDKLVDRKLQELQYAPSERCTDEEFLRRVYMDVLGVPPTVEEVRAFLADADINKRSRVINQTLERPEYAKFWALKWGDLLRVTSKRLSDEGLFKFHRWLEETVAQNVPYDVFAKSLLLATGSTSSNPPANFYRTAVDRDDCVETVSQVFLGARLQCAKCHNHPFERWTQDNYYGLGAFFEQVRRKKTSRPNEMLIWIADTGTVTQPRTGQVMKPWLPGEGATEPDSSVDPRRPFVDWLTSPGNPYFARMEVNRIWSQLFAKGIVDPIDDFRDSNPPSNAELLDALASDFVESGYDRKHILKVILNSRTYQSSFRANVWNAADHKYFSHQWPRLLSAEQLLDAIDQAMGVGRTFASLPSGMKATQLPSPDLVKMDFLKVFGQPERSSVCACERSSESNLGMAIEFFNGTVIHDALRAPNNRFRNAIANNQTPPEVIETMYLAILCRYPTTDEKTLAMNYLQQQPTLEIALEDLCWALFNTDEFLFQH